MPDYDRARSIPWPVTFTIEDGRRFAVWATERSANGVDLVMRVHVEGGDSGR